MSRDLRAIWWVKRDFRLYDNAALCRALAECQRVMPVYVFEPLVFEGPDWGQPHAQAIHDGVTSLRKNLQHHGSDLVVRRGPILTIFDELYRAAPFTHLYAHEETGLAHTYARDKAVQQWCRDRGVAFVEVPTNGVIRGLKDRDHWQSLFATHMNLPLRPIPKAELKARADVSGFDVLPGRIPSLKTLGYISNNQLRAVSEKQAHDTLQDFLRVRAHAYSGGISSMNTAPTACSRLSVHLAWGTISLATVLRATRAKASAVTRQPDESAARVKKSLRKFESRLYWHSHFVQKFEDEVEMEQRPVNAVFATGLPYVTGAEHDARLVAWRTGQTGFPAIDAAMRCYAATGWLTFRSRAMITSFATHALRLPWQTIVYELAQLMHDYVPGIHVAQVQMQAGVTGTNTIRVYSPQKQLEDQDPDCVFVKTWVPELAGVSAAAIRQHHTEPVAGYCAPIIDFAAETKIMKDALYAKKKSSSGRHHAKRVYQKHGSRRHTFKK
jgi:deoxyribodipyrimidine photo-lyase